MPDATVPADQAARAYAALAGLAIGDALGMPTQSLSRAQIRERHGTITGFVAATDDQPIAPGMPAGSVTDDTEQALLLAQLLVDGDGHVDPHALADALLAWERSMVERGSHDLLGPSTKAALSALQAGTPPEETGRRGTTNGAAMRIAPVGIAHRDGLGLRAAVLESCQVTHATGLGISGAAAIAAAVSAGIDGAGMDEALEVAVTAARWGETQGAWIAGASIPGRLAALRPLAADRDDDAFADLLVEVVGTSVQSQESVVVALLVADRFRDDAVAGLACTAGLGGDTDTIGAMAGAVLGANGGADAFPEAMVRRVEEVNGLDLRAVADRLLSLRPAP